MSCVAPDEAEPLHHALKCAMSAAYSFCSIGCDAEKALGASSAFRRRFASMRSDVSFSLQAIQSGVHRADRYLAVRAKFDLLAHSYPVGAIFQPQEREDDDVLEFAKIIAVAHYLYNIE